ncbi:MAG: cell division protein FtsQ/DivIB [Methylovulum sp.]|jgi:cell division protein FtsQ|nr:cell division protein FtsQ/DivIB [Methylovulum sp.]MCF7997916.1 cell division protein FtsQ/DivIB [Methylovulum sp.]
MDKLGAKILLIGLLVLAGPVGLFLYKNDKLTFRLKLTSLPVKFVRAEGVFQYLGKDELKSVLEPIVTTSFFEADMQTIHDTVATLPWVETVSVKRIWPDAIDVKIREKKAYVRWGQDSLMTEQGVIFMPKSIGEHQHLTILTGPVLQQVKVLEIMKGIKTALADQSLELAEFDVNDRWAWRIKLTSGLEILLGREEQLDKLQRFLKTLSILKPEYVDAMAVVDLRYPNGYAVSWLAEAGEIDWKNGTMSTSRCEDCADNNEQH